MSRRALNLSREEIDNAVKSTNSAKEAATLLGVTYSSYRRYAERYGLYLTNQGGRGKKRPRVDGKGKTPLEQILVKGSNYKSSALKPRLFAAGLKENRCEECNLGPEWLTRILVMHLDHIDGDNTNNELSNLRILCPNCHSQTPTYCRGQYRGNRKTLQL